MTFDAQFRDDLECLFCGGRERPSITRLDQGDPAVPAARAAYGVCEACAVEAYWKWHGLKPDAVPLEPRLAPTRVKVVAARLRDLGDGLMPPADAAASYEIAMAVDEEGGLDLPSADLARGEDELVAAGRALAEVGIASWPNFCEPIYTGYTTRGTLCRVYAASAWYQASGSARRIDWRAWPPSASAGARDGLYLALGEVWPLLIWKNLARSPRPSAVSFQVSRAAVEYIALQDELRQGKKRVDASLGEYLRRGMSDDDRLVEKKLAEAAARRQQVEAEAARPAAAGGASEVAGADDELPEIAGADDGQGPVFEDPPASEE